MPATPPDLMQMLDRLLATPSVSSTDARFDQGNINVIHLLAEWLEPLGFKVRVLQLPGHPDKANLIATLGSGPGGLVLSGHTDTVPYDESLWNVDPLRLTERDGRLYGLGATDMKGFFPIAIEAARAFRAGDLQEPLIILATADEESSMDGARELVRLGLPHGRYAIIGEPTGLHPVRCHKGMLMESVRVVGRSGHSSNPQLGANALEGMHRVLGELLALRRDWQSRYRNPMFDVAVPTLNLASIHGGDNPNRICGHCELGFDIRPLPGMDPDALRAEIDHRLQVLAGDGELRIVRESLIGGVDPFEEAPDSPLVRATEELTGHAAGAVAFATEGPLLQQLGLQTVVLGPGSIDQAHQPNEHMQLAQVRPAIDLYQRLIERFCVGKSAAERLQSGFG